MREGFSFRLKVGPSTKTQRARIRNSITNAKPANKTSLTQIILE
ncbi:MAG: hypothetical protein ACI9EA_001588, partial [Pseudomonadales bacterium]